MGWLGRCGRGLPNRDHVLWLGIYWQPTGILAGAGLVSAPSQSVLDALGLEREEQTYRRRRDDHG
jgi:hypothetical protein